MNYGPAMMVTTYIMILLILVVSLFLKPKEYQKMSQSSNKIITAVKTAFFISLFPLSLFISQDMQAITTVYPWAPLLSMNLHLAFKFDFYSLMFTSVALFVSWAIMEYSLWYMHLDPLQNRFFKFLLVFLMAMIILVTANNLFQLFIGWEGVGILSFLLISWWYGRANACVAALQAVLYNRIADIGLFMALAWMATNINSWDFPVLLSLSEEVNTSPLLMGLILSSMGKSAQLSLHPWLLSAMEGPTPVSALLHSSTMVVAGIFLLIRFSPLFSNNPFALTACLCLGSITSMFMAYCALSQNDIKKIVAFSTSSQLGLMMVAIGLNQPQLAFIHICSHAFFKAMLFLCAGAMIHALDGEQDIRKMGGVLHMAPVTSSCMTIGCFALTGMPFLSGFFSKDAILEALSTSYLNAGALALTLLATVFTAAYSFRMIYFLNMDTVRIYPITPMSEQSPAMINPLKRLAWGSLFAGLILINNILPLKTPVTEMPLMIKIAALLITITGIWAALKTASRAAKAYYYEPPLAHYHYPNALGGHPLIMHILFPKWVLNFGQNLSNFILDQTWLEKLWPKTTNRLMTPGASTQEALQKGMVMIYLCLFTLSNIMAVSYLYLFN